MILLDVKIYFQGRVWSEGLLNSGTWVQKVNIKAVNAGFFFFHGRLEMLLSSLSPVPTLVVVINP